MRSIAHQTDEELGGTVSVLVRQKRDHVRLDRLLQQLASTAGTQDEEETLNRIYRLVFSHAFAEEAVLWPVLRRVLPDGQDLTLRVEREHQEVNELVARLQAGRPGDAQRRELLDRLVGVLREDVRDEEDVLLPRLQDAVGPAGLRGLGLAWEAVRRTAPTRAHPAVARRPLGNVVAALPLSVIDRSRDVVEAAAHRGPARLAPALGAAGTGLASAATRVERLSPLRRGGNPPSATGHEGSPS